MKSFPIHLRSATQYQLIEGVTSFVGEDASGSFGILPGHFRMITTLQPGLARYRQSDGAWQFVACPGAVLYFCDNTLQLSTRRYIHGSDYQSISQALQDDILSEEEKLRSLKQSMIRLEEEMLRRLWELQHEMPT